MEIPWEAIVAIVLTLGGAALQVWHGIDKRLDKLESDSRLIQYQLEILTSDIERRSNRFKQAIQEITLWLQKRGFVPRSQTTDGPWPSADPPTQSFPAPKDR